ncbi:hypothetical protein JCM3770_006451 [Rhodotorula araucariae]
MLSRAALQSARGESAAALSAPATRKLTRAVVAAPLAAVASTSAALQVPLASRPFATSAPAQESRARRKTRLVRKANLEKNASLVRQHAHVRPDPVLGYAHGNDDLWNSCRLNSILLNRQDVWGDVVQVDGAAPDRSAERYTPKLFNFGLDQATAEHLSSVLPATAALRATLGDGATTVDAVLLERFERATDQEDRKRDALMRIVDLRNADSKGIEVENTRRIVAAFGRTPGDTASPEVQAAILTMRIRSLSAHLISSPRDVQNRQALRLLISRRAKVLKYLRAVSVPRYEDCLEHIGVEPRAVEGEVIVGKHELRRMIRGA